MSETSGKKEEKSATPIALKHIQGFVMTTSQTVDAQPVAPKIDISPRVSAKLDTRIKDIREYLAYYEALQNSLDNSKAALNTVSESVYLTFTSKQGNSASVSLSEEVISKVKEEMKAVVAQSEKRMDSASLVVDEIVSLIEAKGWE